MVCRWSGRIRSGPGCRTWWTCGSGGSGCSKRRTVEVVEGGGGRGGPPPRSTALHRPPLPAVGVERRRQVCRDVLGGPSLDVLALEHEDELPVLEERHLWRRRRVTPEVAAGALSRLGVLAGEDREESFGPARMPERERRGGSRVPGGAAAHGVHDDERRVVRRPEDSVDLCGRTELLEPDAGELLAHRLDEAGVVEGHVQACHCHLE